MWTLQSIVFLIAFVLLLGAGTWAAFKYGSLNAYIWFSWVVPLAGAYWWRYELNLSINASFILSLVWFSFFLSIVCFPILLLTNWSNLSALKFLGLVAGSFLNSIPFLTYALLTIYPPR